MPEPKYTPAVGDVVEFEYTYKDNGRTLDGIIGLTASGDPCVWAMFIGKKATWCGFEYCGNIRKTGDSGKTGHQLRGQDNVMDNYFSEPEPTTPELSYAERQEAWVSANNIVVGSKVRVVKGYRNGDEGFDLTSICDTYNCDSKKDQIGSVGKVTHIHTTGLQVFEEDRFTFPYFVLEPVK